MSDTCFDPDKVERREQWVGWVDGEKCVAESDFDQLLALYRQREELIASLQDEGTLFLCMHCGDTLPSRLRNCPSGIAEFCEPLPEPPAAVKEEI